MYPSPFTTKMTNRNLNFFNMEGRRPYPASSLEIMLLDHSCQLAQQKEVNKFATLCDQFDWHLSRRKRKNYLDELNQNATLVLTDASQAILWTSYNFMRMTGYRPADVLGLKPVFLQGPDTDPQAIQYIRGQLSKLETVDTDILNYRKDGSPYICHLMVDPLRNRQGKLTHFLAVEHEVL